MSHKPIRELIEYRLSKESGILDAKQRSLLAARYTENKTLYNIAAYSSTSVDVIRTAIEHALDTIRTNDESYETMIKRQSEEINKPDSYGHTLVKWAFSREQFGVIATEWGEPECNIISVSDVPGMFCTKADADKVWSIFEKHYAEKILATKCNEFLCGALYRELNNHEYVCSGETKDAKLACGITDSYINNEKDGPNRINAILTKARKRCIEDTI